MTTALDSVPEAELRDLLAKATPGPWAIERQELDADFSDEDQEQAFPECVGPLWLAPGMSPDEPPQIEADVALVIAAVNALPELLAALDATRAERDALVSRLGPAGTHPGVAWRNLNRERDQMAALASGLAAAVHRTIDGEDRGRKAAAWHTVMEFTTAIERLTEGYALDPDAALDAARGEP